jgi:hypothetical protein
LTKSTKFSIIDNMDATTTTPHRHAKRMVEWCEENISEKEYHHPQLAGFKAGGDGWEIYAGSHGASAFIEDEALQAFFMLAFAFIKE